MPQGEREVCLLSIGVLGWVKIRQKFDPFLLLPADSYLRQWNKEIRIFYPDEGWEVSMYSGEILYSDLAKIEDLDVGLHHLKEETKELRDVNSWWSLMKKYTEEKTNFSSWQEFANPKDFPVVLSDFLFSKYGAEYKQHFQFKENLRCNQPAPPIIATEFTIRYFQMEGPEKHIPARRAVSNVIKNSGSPYTFSHSKIYVAWETDEIIGYELWRNMGLVIACVFVITLLLLTNLKMCLLVIMNMVITLTDIVGFLHFWDITIDIISCVNIVLAIGLCVDYSVHIGHAFLVAKGSRQEKTIEAISKIGPAVFNGGVTTFLALVLCSMSSSHAFITFFKVFSLTVVFGLFHGLVLLPVILSLIGPIHLSEEESCLDGRRTDGPQGGKQACAEGPPLE